MKDGCGYECGVCPCLAEQKNRIFEEMEKAMFADVIVRKGFEVEDLTAQQRKRGQALKKKFGVEQNDKRVA